MTSDYKPRYEQIADQLRSEINDQRFEPGDKLPSEKRLCEYFDVSRVTVRQALQNLEQQGLIFRKQGLGSFVSKQKLNQPLVHLTDFSEDMKRAGHESTSKLISLKKVAAIAEVNEVLELPNDSALIQVDRVRLANNKPIAVDVTWLPPGYGQLLFDENLTTQTIYQILEEKYDIPITGGRYKITATVADAYLAEHLEVNIGDAVLEIDRCSKTIGDKKIYFQKRYNNPEFIAYELVLSRNEEMVTSFKEGFPLKEFTPKFYTL
ncbi:MAG: GntR family transcriptional regulator [Balneolaceae bacterium]